MEKKNKRRLKCKDCGIMLRDPLSNKSGRCEGCYRKWMRPKINENRRQKASSKKKTANAEKTNEVKA